MVGARSSPNHNGLYFNIYSQNRFENSQQSGHKTTSRRKVIKNTDEGEGGFNLAFEFVNS